MTTYQDTWPADRRLGWLGTIPLRPGTKWPPPDGFTGWDGVDPSPADCAEFDELPTYRGTAQKAYRMPSTVVGLDRDGYDGKTGLRTIAEAERRWGALPAGPWSSARADGSGIAFYRVPDGTVLVSNIAFPDLGLGHVEVIQRHHRYAVVWPSTHPSSGARYTWRDTTGPGQPPAVDDLPVLPDAWLVALAGTGRQGERARPEDVVAFLAALPAGTACEAVRIALREADTALRKPVRSRHDDTCAHVLRLLRLGEQGHPGAPAALGALKAVFIRIVTADGSRTTASAEGEFDRMAEGSNGIGLIRATATPAQWRGCRCSATVQPPTRAALTGILRAVLNAERAEQARLLRWADRKFRSHVAAGHLEPEHADRLIAQLTDSVDCVDSVAVNRK